MKCVILAGGTSTRITEESSLKPKPMIEIGGRPIIWHIMKFYSSYGVSEFVICLGYKGYLIKEFFANYFLHQADVTLDISKNERKYHECRSEPWKVTLVDTGEETMTGGRLRRVREYLRPGETFCLTYGDGLSDVNVERQIAFHHKHGGKATIACVRPPARFGRVVSTDYRVTSFEEKPLTEGGSINGGFFVLEPSVVDLIEGDDTIWEKEPLEQLATAGELHAWPHDGFWHPIDTLRDMQSLNIAWNSGSPPWKRWKN